MVVIRTQRTVKKDMKKNKCFSFLEKKSCFTFHYLKSIFKSNSCELFIENWIGI